MDLFSTFVLVFYVMTSYFSDALRRVDRDVKFMTSHPEYVKKLPGAIIIGVKKGGTRALLEFLRTHPGIRATGPEVHYFDKNYHRGLDWYRDRMPPSLPGQLTMEKTPSYFITESAPRRIYKMSNSTKLLVVLRDPVTRLLSDYTQLKHRRPDLPPLKDLAFLNAGSGLVDSSWTPVRIGQYSRYLRHWYRYFPRNQIHLVSGEQLISNPASVLNNIQTFLGLPLMLNQNHFVYNQTKGFPCVRKNKRVHCLAESKGRAHVDMSTYLVDRLRSYYRPFNHDLYQLTGEHFGWD